MIVLIIPMLLIALWIKLESPGPVLFKQKRYGRNKVPFYVYKLRTMRIDAPANQPTNAFSQSTSYITRSGRINRRIGTDELPQLINVIKGDMSIVGPRPVILKEKDLIAERDIYGANAVKPGITGWAQVNGRDEVSLKQKAFMDGEYAQNFGPKMDLLCILHTILVLVKATGYNESVVITEDYKNKVYAETVKKSPFTRLKESSKVKFSKRKT